MTKATIKLYRYGNILAEVEVHLIPDDGAWGPYLSNDDVRKIERVNKALKNGDVTAASKDAKIFELHPVAAE